MKQLPIRILDSSVDNIPLLRSMNAKLQAIHLIPLPPRAQSPRDYRKREGLLTDGCVKD
jgi:hypothetical protein